MTVFKWILKTRSFNLESLGLRKWSDLSSSFMSIFSLPGVVDEYSPTIHQIFFSQNILSFLSTCFSAHQLFSKHSLTILLSKDNQIIITRKLVCFTSNFFRWQPCFIMHTYNTRRFAHSVMRTSGVVNTHNKTLLPEDSVVINQINYVKFDYKRPCGTFQLSPTSDTFLVHRLKWKTA